MSNPILYSSPASRGHARRVIRPVASMIAFIAIASAQQPSTSDAVRFLEQSTFG